MPEYSISGQEKKGKSRLNFPGLEVAPVFKACSLSKKENWGIQVGAYSSSKPAHLIIKLAKQHLGLSKDQALSKVERIKRPHGIIFRARVIGLEQSAARDACTILINKHLPCVPVPADIELAQAPSKK